MGKNSVFEGEITGYNAEGSGIVRTPDGMVVFVRGGARGDFCEILVIKEKSSVAWGIIKRIIKPSDFRVVPECSVFCKNGSCGGCDFWHINYEEELYAKACRVESAFERIGGIVPFCEGIIPAGDIHYWRNKALLPVGKGSEGAFTGFYRSHSHDIVPVEECLISAAESNICAGAFREWIDRYDISIYNERSRTGLIRRLYTRVSQEGEIMACAVTANRDVPHVNELISILRERSPTLSGVLINHNSSSGNRVLGKEFTTVWGEGDLKAHMLDIKLSLPPGAFCQVNHTQAEKLYMKALEYAAPKDEDVLELYCGSGLMALSAAREARSVIGIEISSEAIETARIGAIGNGIDNTIFYAMDACEAEKLNIKPGVIIADPPRAGLSEEVCALIGHMNPKRLVYISCDPATMARDIKRLASYGIIALKYTIVDMFPRTANVESVMLLAMDN